MQKELLNDIKGMKNARLLAGMIAVAILLGYGYLLIRSAIGIDDTCIERYFVEGWAPHVGRWTLYLLNLVFDFAHFTPFFMEAVGVVLLGLSAYLFCVLWDRISSGRVPTLALAAFALVYVTFPLAGEVYMYYLHNGVSLAFCLLALCGIYWWEYRKKGKVANLIWITVLLALAIGCYESFALVYLVLLCGVRLWSLWNEETAKQSIKDAFRYVITAILPLVGAMVIRTVAYTLINLCIGIPADARDMSKLRLWIVNNPLVILKDLAHQFVVRYVINAAYIWGILVFVVFTLLFVATVSAVAFGRRKWSMLLWGGCMMIAPWLLVIVEIVVTPYRATQALMLFVPFAALFCFEVLLRAGSGKMTPKISVALAVLLFVIVFRQAFELHQFFYFDSLKEDYSKAYCQELAYELYRNYDTSEKPVVFIGQPALPASLREQVYKDVDEVAVVHYNYVDEFGYRIWDVACQDTLAWASWADLGDGEYEIYAYMAMQGYDFKQPDAARREELRKEALVFTDTPVWPMAGSIVEKEDVICVYLGPVRVDL